MTNFDESKIRRGQPDNAGKFRDKGFSKPETGLNVSPAEGLIASIVDWLPEGEPWRDDPNRLARTVLTMTNIQGNDDIGNTASCFGPKSAVDQATDFRSARSRRSPRLTRIGLRVAESFSRRQSA